jgi:hypothetical protein
LAKAQGRQLTLHIVLAMLMWLYPIVWLNLYALLLMLTNKITLHFGQPLYMLISGDFLVLLWAVTYLTSFLPFFQIKWFRENTIYILAVWLLISAFSLLSTTQGTFKEVFQRAAGKVSTSAPGASSEPDSSSEMDSSSAPNASF